MSAGAPACGGGLSNPAIYLSFYLSIHVSIYLSTYLSIHLSFVECGAGSGSQSAPAHLSPL